MTAPNPNTWFFAYGKLRTYRKLALITAAAWAIGAACIYIAPSTLTVTIKVTPSLLWVVFAFLSLNSLVIACVHYRRVKAMITLHDVSYVLVPAIYTVVWAIPAAILFISYIRLP